MSGEPQPPVLVTSRSFAEYVAFLGLDPDRLPASVLDVSAGAASFVAEASDRGLRAVAVDPVYGVPRPAFDALVAASAPGAARLVAEHADRFTFAWYGTSQRRVAMRAEALTRFGDHRSSYPGRYVAAALPDLPFADGSFELAVCSHLLFTWADDLDEAWHRAALLELCRVAGEVRVFPLVRLGAGEPVDFLPGLLADLRRDHGVHSRIVEVGYEFQVGARQVLVLHGPVAGPV